MTKLANEIKSIVKMYLYTDCFLLTICSIHQKMINNDMLIEAYPASSRVTKWLQSELYKPFNFTLNMNLVVLNKP